MGSVLVYVLMWAVTLPFLPGVTEAEDARTTHLLIRVTDPSGTPIPHAEIRVDKFANCIHSFLWADRNGTFAVDLTNGDYFLEVRSPGFALYKQPLHIERLSVQIFNVTLNVGSCTQCVEVEPVTAVEPAVRLPSPSPKRLPVECRDQFNLKTGVPLFFSAEDGVRYGVSLAANHLSRSLSIPLQIWIDNPTDQSVELGACSMFQNMGLSLVRRSLKSIRKRDAVEGQSASAGACSCSVDMKIHVASHTCAIVREVYMDEMYNLTPGVYTVVQRRQLTSRESSQKGTAGVAFQVR